MVATHGERDNIMHKTAVVDFSGCLLLLLLALRPGREYDL